MAQADYFLKIGEIKAECSDSEYPDHFQLDNWSWGQSNSGSATTGQGLGAGKVSMQDFHFTVRMSKGTPPLMLACASGDHIAKATLFCRKAGGTKQETYLKISFEDVLISSYQVGGAADGGNPMEQISFNYVKHKVEYSAQKTKGGGLEAPVSAGWDQKANKKW